MNDDFPFNSNQLSILEKYYLRVPSLPDDSLLRKLTVTLNRAEDVKEEVNEEDVKRWFIMRETSNGESDRLKDVETLPGKEEERKCEGHLNDERDDDVIALEIASEKREEIQQRNFMKSDSAETLSIPRANENENEKDKGNNSLSPAPLLSSSSPLLSSSSSGLPPSISSSPSIPIPSTSTSPLSIPHPEHPSTSISHSPSHLPPTSPCLPSHSPFFPLCSPSPIASSPPLPLSLPSPQTTPPPFGLRFLLIFILFCILKKILANCLYFFSLLHFLKIFFEYLIYLLIMN